MLLLLSQGIFQADAGDGGAVKVERVSWDVGRHEEGKTLDVIPVEMTENE